MYSITHVVHCVTNTFDFITYTVPNLPVCVDERTVPQCCVVDFILERLNATEEDFLEGLRDQLRERFRDFRDITDNLRQCESNIS